MQTAQTFNDAEAFLAEANALYQQGRPAEAATCYQQALTLKPDMVEALGNLGNILKDQGNMEAAIDHYQRALRLRPKLAGLHYNLGVIYHMQTKLPEAIKSYRRAIKINPDNAETQQNLGVVLHQQNKPKQAIACYRQAIKYKPDHVEAHNNLGIALQAVGNLDAAREAFQQTILLKPDYLQAYDNLSVLLCSQGKLTEAMDLLNTILAMDPNFASAYNHKGRILKQLDKPAEAINCYRRALALQPDHVEAHSNLIFALDFDPDSDLSDEQAERKRWANIHAAPLSVYIKAHSNVPDPERRLRIGYVSADFCRHSATSSFGQMLLSYDKSSFDVICYSGVEKEDAITQQFRKSVSEWRSTIGLSDEALVDLIRTDEIDILVDLSGHTSGNRLLTFARKPAPIQVSGWGHATGTGLNTMDYLFSDPMLVPTTDMPLFTEEVIHLPCATGYLPPPDAPPVASLPANSHGYVSFGCFNRIEKISVQAFSLWAQILQALPQSRLLLKSSWLSTTEAQQAALEIMKRAGMDTDRVILLGRTTQREHMDAYKQVDISLDPFPLGGGVSTMESLWMGVPVIALHGSRIPGRISPSILTTVGLKEFIADSLESYKSIAISMASDEQRLATLRNGLRLQMATSILGDPKKYVPAVEQAYRTMWRRWCEEVKH